MISRDPCRTCQSGGGDAAVESWRQSPNSNLQNLPRLHDHRPALRGPRNFRSGTGIGRGVQGPLGAPEGGRHNIEPTRSQTPQHRAPRRQRVASDARLRHCQFKSWDLDLHYCLRFGLLRERVSYMTFSGAQGRCADRCAALRADESNHVDPTSGRGLPIGIPLGVWVKANAGHTTCGVRLFCHPRTATGLRSLGPAWLSRDRIGISP